MSLNNDKIWRVMSVLEDKFTKKYPEYGRVVLQLLRNRGIIGGEAVGDAREAIDEFLCPDYKRHTHDPFLFRDMETVVEKIIEHVKKQSRITVYGDYDADGVTASAIMVETLGTLRANVGVYIPDRVTEGYGLNREALRELAKQGTKLVVTVDNGIRNREEVEYAEELGLEVIVTDHHVPPDDPKEWPDCPIVNPLITGEKYPYKYLAGVGVAFKTAKAVITKAKLPDADKRLLEDRIMDLLAVGTVADCVSLLGENRVLVRSGLRVLNETKRIGLTELIKVAGIEGRWLDAWNIGFQIGPRLNAAGRLDHANTAFELLVTRDEQEAGTLARRLDERNAERQKITDEVVGEIERSVRSTDEQEKVIVAVSPSVYGQGNNWNEGVIGLAAGRVNDKYYKPVIVITGNKDEMKGSGRSVEEFNLVEAIEECREYLSKYGGHAGAAGLSIAGADNLKKFMAGIKEIARKRLAETDLRPKVDIEAELDLSEVSEQLVTEVDRLAPFGQDNPRPKFVSRGVHIVDIFHMGLEGQHIKLRLKSVKSGVLSAVGFGQSETWEHLEIDDVIDIVYYAEINEFNGRREVQLKIVDIKKI